MIEKAMKREIRWQIKEVLDGRFWTRTGCLVIKAIVYDGKGARKEREVGGKLETERCMTAYVAARDLPSGTGQDR